jgi:hypothetical protein
MPVIPVTWEVEIEVSWFKARLEGKVSETPYLTKQAGHDTSCLQSQLLKGPK